MRGPDKKIIEYEHAMCTCNAFDPMDPACAQSEGGGGGGAAAASSVAEAKQACGCGPCWDVIRQALRKLYPFWFCFLDLTEHCGCDQSNEPPIMLLLSARWAWTLPWFRLDLRLSIKRY